MAQRTSKPSSIKDVPPSSWERLAHKKIYFGHQSVGFNIIDGVKDLMRENAQITLNIVETSDQADFNVAIFGHSRVGQNSDPRSKTDSFATLIEHGIGGKADIAFFKYCYVDFDAGSNVTDVFNYYENTMARLKQEFPQTTFIHVTTPLRTTKTTWKTWIKKLMGKKEIWEYDDNIKRNEFNELLLKQYAGKEPVFDLARVESTYPDGRRSTFTKAGKTYYSLVPDYTRDGGHLNETGRKKAAEQLLILLTYLN